MESGQSSVVPALSAAVGPRRSKISKSNLRSQTPSNIKKNTFSRLSQSRFQALSLVKIRFSEKPQKFEEIFQLKVSKFQN